MDIENRINEILENKVRPHLSEHNGDIEFVSLRDGIVEVKLLGQCSSCISADQTVRDTVETALKEALPEIKGVQLVKYINQDMLDMARKILNKGK